MSAHEKTKTYLLWSLWFYSVYRNNSNFQPRTERLHNPVQEAVCFKSLWCCWVRVICWVAPQWGSSSMYRVMGGRGRAEEEGFGARAGYLSVERGGISESRWEGRWQLCRVQRVWRPHVWAAGIESGHCELICGKKKRRGGVRSATSDGGSGHRERKVEVWLLGGDSSWWKWSSARLFPLDISSSFFIILDFLLNFLIDCI